MASVQSIARRQLHLSFREAFEYSEAQGAANRSSTAERPPVKETATGVS